MTVTWKHVSRGSRFRGKIESNKRHSCARQLVKPPRTAAAAGRRRYAASQPATAMQPTRRGYDARVDTRQIGVARGRAYK
eukprot:2199432-Prymnesium_polylepis.1